MAAERFLTLMDELEAAFAPRLAPPLEAAAREFALNAIQGGFAHVILPQMARDLQAVLTELWTESIRQTYAVFTEEYADGFPAAKADDLLTNLIENYINGYRPGIAQQILDTTQRQIRASLSGGLLAGQAADEVYAELLETLPGVSGIRGLLVSRTEIHSATQFASWQFARRSSVRLRKVWNSVNDLRTRDFGEGGKISAFNHRVMDQSSVGVDDHFLVPRVGGGFEHLMFPGDPRGSAGNIINCRCIQLYERA